MSADQQVQQFMQQLQTLEQYAVELGQRESTLQNMMREAHSAVAAIRGLKEKPNTGDDNNDSEVLVPIGMGVFIKTKVSLKENFVLNVGAGITIEKDHDYTLNFLEAKIKEIEIALQDTVQKRQHTLEQLERGKNEINQLMHQQQHLQPPPSKSSTSASK